VTNVELVTRKLAIVEEHVRRLKARRPADLAVFERDLVLQDAVALGILVLVQEAMDIALHIASDEGWELASTYREAFGVLKRHAVLDSGLAIALSGTAHLRNRIARGYASVDAARLWQDLPAGIATFEEFSTAIAIFLRCRSEAGEPGERGKG